jgi:hypothetical protein
MLGDQVAKHKTSHKTPHKTPAPAAKAIKKAAEKKSIDGHIVAAREPYVDTVASNMIVHIDAGSAQTLAPGDILEAYETQQTKDKSALPPRVIGELLVIDTKSSTSTAVVIGSAIELQVGNKIRYKQ